MPMTETSEKLLLCAYQRYLCRCRDGMTQHEARVFAPPFFSYYGGIAALAPEKRQAALDNLSALECMTLTADGGFLLTPKALMYLDLRFGGQTRQVLAEIADYL